MNWRRMPYIDFVHTICTYEPSYKQVCMSTINSCSLQTNLIILVYSSINTNLIYYSRNLSILDLGHGMIYKSAINALMIATTAVYAFEAKMKKVRRSER